MNGSQALWKALQEQGVKHSFGLTGGSVIPLFDEYFKDNCGIRHIPVRHEQGAAHAADGYARASGKPGVCIATSGPGATNLVTGIMTAFMDSSPIVALGGQVPTSLIGNDAFQESDMIGITFPITKHNYQVRSPNRVRAIVQKAFNLASSGRPGPVYIDLPKDALAGKVEKEESLESMNGKKNQTAGFEELKKAAELLLNAERPVLLIGGGVILANASKEAEELALKYNIPVTTTLMGKSAFPETHPLSLGMLGMHGRKAANYAMVNSDVVFAVGCRFNDRITGKLQTFLQNATLIHTDVDAAEINKNVKSQLSLRGDAKQVLKEVLKIAEKITARKSNEWSEKMKKLAKECECNINLSSNPIDPRKVIFEINKAIKEEDIVTTGVGQHQMFAAHFLKRTKPRTFISSGGAGTMGFGFPAAIGAKLAKPESEVLNIDGDGSFGMVVQELGTCKAESIKVTPVIFNNSYLGMVRQWIELFYEKRYSAVCLGASPDFAKLAEAYCVKGITVERHSEIQPALQQALKNDETTVLNVLIAQESNIVPMFAAGTSINEMFGDCVPKGYFNGD
ncbi:MAG: biosynthetic-type acetolactate synthase large subunit [Candidatus Diapherotrites archaeon]|uniref:Acetolactate synthase n=1 Tax=Candidatus Iainarchaeum sp. TaxID=3101447 RepID=A0A7J4JUB6_9ARCH|nr:biosynthetic-type acetolactate synthase large subunit [Candidatus Diapherotrites archaeon]HIH21381.1 biosynthetic-type acetolactate synthase large subunit [Candidatus Diapherotrites archaeon]